MTNEQYDKANGIRVILEEMHNQRRAFCNSVDDVGFYSGGYPLNTPHIMQNLQEYKDDMKDNMLALIDREIAAKQAEFDAL